MNNKLAVYVGTFDPLTIGHLWVIERGVALFDRLIVATGENFDKQCMFSAIDRLDMLKQSVNSLLNVEVRTFHGQSIIAYAKEVSAQYIIRGIRNMGDYENERRIRNVHDGIDLEIITVFLMPPSRIAGVSSTKIKDLISHGGWEKIVRGYVPEPVFKKLYEFCYKKGDA